MADMPRCGDEEMKIIGNGGHAKVIRSFENRGHPGLVAFVAIGDNHARKLEAEALKGYIFRILKHPGAWIDETAKIGEGTVIMAGAIVAADVHIGRHCIINHGATVDHDCVIEDYVHIAPGAHLCGGVMVGEGALVGVGVGIAPGAVIPAWSLVKARRLEIVPLPGH